MKNLFYTIILLSFCACAKYETRFEGPYTDPTTATKVLASRTVLFVEDGIIKWTDVFLKKAEKVIVKDAAFTARASASNLKIAYSKVSDGSVVVVDSSGANPQIVPGSAGANCFFWHNNDKTLCFVNTNLQLKTFGPAVTLEITDLSKFIPGLNVADVIGMEMLPDGRLIGLFKTTLGFQEYHYISVRETGGYNRLLPDNLHPEWLRVSKGTKPTVFYGHVFYTTPRSYESVLFESGVSSSPIKLTDSRWTVPNPIGNSQEVMSIYNNKLYINSFSIPVDAQKVTSLDW